MFDFECPKCKAEYNATDSPDDAGEHECDECGFVFIVEIDYEPSYDATCLTHEFGEWETFVATSRSLIGEHELRSCKYCGKCEVREDG